MSRISLAAIVATAWGLGFGFAYALLGTYSGIQAPPSALLSTSALWLGVNALVAVVLTTLRSIIGDAGVPRAKHSQISEVSDAIRDKCILLLAMGSVAGLAPVVAVALNLVNRLSYSLISGSCVASLLGLFLIWRWMHSVDAFYQRLVQARRKKDEMKQLSGELQKR